MIDFTHIKYKSLLQQFTVSGFKFFTYYEYLSRVGNTTKFVILRHDVDKLANHALKMAQIEHDFGIKGTYYFRTDKNGFNKKIINNIYKLGHEIGYHYENLSTNRGDYQIAYQDFEKKITNLRKIVPVNTICMHGSPFSKWDNRNLWKYKNYKELGVLGEPYFDTNFNQVCYLTDTGRMWDGKKFNIRDFSNTNDKIDYHKTNDILIALKNGNFPKKIMMTIHPQRWTNNCLVWTYEYLFQNIKNLIKSIVRKT